MYKMKEKYSDRNSAIELLRIIAMVAITYNHIDTFYNIIALNSPNHANEAITVFFIEGGKFGCNVFLIISSWYISSLDLRMDRIFKIVRQTIFFSLFLDTGAIILSLNGFSLIAIPKQLIRVMTGSNYWYAFSYCFLLMMLPVIKRAKTKVKNEKICLIFTFIIVSVLPTLTSNFAIFGSKVRLIYKIFMARYAILFIFIFCATQYFKAQKMRIGKQEALLLLSIPYVLMYVLSYSMLVIGKSSNNAFCLENYKNIRDMPSLLCICSAYGLFFVFRQLHVKSNKFINSVAKHTFGVYLLQAHPAFRYLWIQSWPLDKVYLNGTVWSYLLMSTLLVIFIFAMGILVDIIWQKIDMLLFGSRK